MEGRRRRCKDGSLVENGDSTDSEHAVVIIGCLDGIDPCFIDGETFCEEFSSLICEGKFISSLVSNRIVFWGELWDRDEEVSCEGGVGSAAFTCRNHQVYRSTFFYGRGCNNDEVFHISTCISHGSRLCISCTSSITVIHEVIDGGACSVEGLYMTLRVESMEHNEDISSDFSHEWIINVVHHSFGFEGVEVRLIPIIFGSCVFGSSEYTRNNNSDFCSTDFIIRTEIGKEIYSVCSISHLFDLTGRSDETL